MKIHYLEVDLSKPALCAGWLLIYTMSAAHVPLVLSRLDIFLALPVLFAGWELMCLVSAVHVPQVLSQFREHSNKTLTHSFPMYPFSTPWKHQKTLWFSDVFRA